MSANPTTLIIEQRFPLNLKESIHSIREMYETGKQERWVPESDIPWSEFDASRYTDQELRAARLTWSWRSWVEYAGLTETPAMLIRWCLEKGRESDPKYFLTVRNTEEAWHIESFSKLANLMGGYLNHPVEATEEALFLQHRDRKILDENQHSDAMLVTHCAVEDGLELELFKGHLANSTNPVVTSLLKKVVQAKERHAEFGWVYATERSALWKDQDRDIIGHTVHRYLETVELAGYHCPWLRNPESETAQAMALTAHAGLGAAPMEKEREILVRYLANVRQRLAQWGVELPPLHHSIIGTL